MTLKRFFRDRIENFLSVFSLFSVFVDGGGEGILKKDGRRIERERR